MRAVGEGMRLGNRGFWVAALWASALAVQAEVPAGAVSASPSISDLLTADPVEGQSLGAWTAQWWRWVFAHPMEPYLDPDGRFCDLGQDGPVWFLAGTDGSFKPKRRCVVPEGKHLLLPVINMIYMQSRELRSASCKALQASVAVNNDHLASAVVLLDGKPLGDIALHRVRSDGCFRLDPEDASSVLAAADGYWLMLKPLSRGRHTISVGANYAAPDSPHGGMEQSFEYELDVGGEALLSDAVDGADCGRRAKRLRQLESVNCLRSLKARTPIANR